MEGREQKSIRKGGRETRGGRDGGKRKGREGGGWMGSNGAQRTSLCEVTVLCVCVRACNREVGVFWEEGDSVCREKKRWRERKPEHGCLPGCCSLGPLTGTSTLFSNTAHRQPDKTKTQIYTSLHLSISFCVSVLCYPPVPYLCLAFCFCLRVHLSDCVLFPACVFPSSFVHRGAS